MKNIYIYFVYLAELYRYLSWKFSFTLLANIKIGSIFNRWHFNTWNVTIQYIFLYDSSLDYDFYIIKENGEIHFCYFIFLLFAERKKALYIIELAPLLKVMFRRFRIRNFHLEGRVGSSRDTVINKSFTYITQDIVKMFYIFQCYKTFENTSICDLLKCLSTSQFNGKN